MSVLGLRVGAVAKWQTPGGEEGAAEVSAVLFQPEASGDYSI
jgi:regulator of nucleoside diphosphate kinase